MTLTLPDRIGTALRVDYPDPNTIAAYRFMADVEVVATINVEKVVTSNPFIQGKRYRVCAFIISEGEHQLLDSWLGDEQTIQLQLIETSVRALCRYQDRLTRALQGISELVPAKQNTNPTLWERLNEG